MDNKQASSPAMSYGSIYHLLAAIVEYADGNAPTDDPAADRKVSTGLVDAARRILASAGNKPPKTRVLVDLEGGAIHNITANQADVEVLLCDADVEGADPDGVFRGQGGERYYGTIGPWSIDPALVDQRYLAAGRVDPAPPTRETRVLVVVRRGAIEEIVADRGGAVDVLIMDYDIESMSLDDVEKLPKDHSGVHFIAVDGPTRIGVRTVEKAYSAVAQCDEAISGRLLAEG